MLVFRLIYYVFFYCATFRATDFSPFSGSSQIQLNIIQRNGALDETRVATCCVKKREQKATNTNLITRHNDIAISRDQQSWNLVSPSLEHIYNFF